MKNLTVRESFINFCRKKKVRNIFALIDMLLLSIILIFCFFLKYLKVATILLTILFFLHSIFWLYVVDTIYIQKDSFLKKNKLSTIIFSQKRLWESLFNVFFTLLFIFTIIHISKNTFYSILIAIAFIVFQIFIGLKLSKIIANKIADKLVDKEDLL